MTYDVIIIGAGIVGLSTAYKIQKAHPNWRICIVEKEQGVAKHQTGNNSGVIHSGIYYKPGSLKAINCRKGYDELLVFAKEFGVRHDVCGKVIVATSEAERGILDGIYKRGLENGLAGIEKIGIEAIREKEPHVHGVEGIWVPQTGIIDYPQMCEVLADLLLQHGQTLLFNHKTIGVTPQKGQVTVHTEGGDITGRLVISCAGLYADKIAQFTQPDVDFLILPFRGEYYKLTPEKEYLVKNLIYPVPNPNFPFLGVHFTRMMRGGIEAGPNAVLAFRREGYKRSDVDFKELWETLSYKGFQKVAAKYWRDGLDELHRSYSKAAFTKALQKLLPELTINDLTEGGAGVRAQACAPDGSLIDDFLILEKPQVINVCNAPSPAATACLAIGGIVAEKAAKHLA